MNEFQFKYLKDAYEHIEDNKGRIEIAKEILGCLAPHLPMELETSVRGDDEADWSIYFSSIWTDQIIIYVYRFERDWIDERIFYPLRKEYGISWEVHIPEDSPRINYKTEINGIAVTVSHSHIPHCTFKAIESQVHTNTVRTETKYEMDCMGNGGI